MYLISKGLEKSFIVFDYFYVQWSDAHKPCYYYAKSLSAINLKHEGHQMNPKHDGEKRYQGKTKISYH